MNFLLYSFLTSKSSVVSGDNYANSASLRCSHMSVLVSKSDPNTVHIHSFDNNFSREASSRCSIFQRLCWILLKYLQKLLQSPTYTTMMFYLVKIRHFIYRYVVMYYT